MNSIKIKIPAYTLDFAKDDKEPTVLAKEGYTLRSLNSLDKAEEIVAMITNAIQQQVAEQVGCSPEQVILGQSALVPMPIHVLITPKE